MKYLKSLMIYIIVVIIIMLLITGFILLIPNEPIELTYNEAKIFVIVGIILIAWAIKFHVDTFNI